ncbi:hypothetical protein MNBD_GAMMA15-593 [hydrothermal vent metagenome]|uniref:Uncharacterized protein n=1 Tax=hydrothermal vent metagenome TaxID=652676 RepID=A0A3B0ZAX0_9ZZZZ
MSIKIVMVDAGQLPSGAEFPPLEIPKYGWEEYLERDQAATRGQGVELLAFPDADFSNLGGAQDLCNRISQAVDHYIARDKTDGADQ